MRATRNAGKNTPPAKKGSKTSSPAPVKAAAIEKQDQQPKSQGKATSGKVAAVENEKQEQELKSEPVDAKEEVTSVDIRPEAPSVQPDATGETNTAPAEGAEKPKVPPKEKPVPAKKKAATPRKKATEVDPSKDVAEEKSPDAGTEELKPVDLNKQEASKEDAKESKEVVIEQVDVFYVTEVVAVEEEEEMEREEAQNADEEMEEEDQGEGVENDVGLENAEEDEDNEEYDEEEEEDLEGEEGEGDEGEEGEREDDEGEEGEGEGDDSLLEQRPVQKRKMLEVFVGGLDKDATDEDVKKAFEIVGEVVEVRLTRNRQTGKNKGYAFVRFATIEQAKRAATELERTKIRGKECAVVPSEDNDTLFVGNINKTWKSEQVLEKLKEYGVEGIDEMTLADDPKKEGLNRGFAFLELATHTDAVKAFKRLSQPDALFGVDRSAKVAWAESTEPDEEIIAKVKSVFIDNMPSSWDEAKVKEHFGTYGDIERVVLAREMPRSKRNDFAFINYVTREAAVACVEALKDKELHDGDNEVKVKVELAKPAPRKNQTKGARGGYHVGGSPAGWGKGEGGASRGGRFDQRRGRGRRGLLRGGRLGRGGGRRLYGQAGVQKITRAVKLQVGDERSLDRRPSGAGPTRRPRGAARGGYSRREDAYYGPPRARESSRRGSKEDYMPRGVRLASGFARPRGYSGRPPQEDAYLRRSERGPVYGRDVDGGYGSGALDYGEAGPGIKRSYSALDEDTAYYEAVRRGYPRARVDYPDPGPVSGSLYPESVRTSFGRSSLGGRSALPAIGGGSVAQTPLSIYDQPGTGLGGSHGYSMLSGTGDYMTGAGELRGGSYSSSLYGGRPGSGYGLSGGSGAYY